VAGLEDRLESFDGLSGDSALHKILARWSSDNLEYALSQLQNPRPAGVCLPAAEGVSDGKSVTVFPKNDLLRQRASKSLLQQFTMILA
jgi:hypothetical protein